MPNDELSAPSQQTNDAAGELRRAQEFLGAYVKAQGSFYYKAAIYVNLVLAIGYAGIFTVWSNVRAYLSPGQSLAVAALLLISFSAFILFEVHRGFVESKSMNGLANAIADDDESIRARLAKLQAWEVESSRARIVSGRLWPLIFGISVGGGVLSIVVLLGSVLLNLVAP